ALPEPDYVPGPEEPEQAPPSPVYIPYPLPAAASPTADLPGYIPESNPDEDPEDDDDEDPEEDPADYPTDHDDDDDEEEEEPSGDDADEEDEEQDEDDDDEEEEHSASADSIPPPPALRVTARISFRPQPPTLFFTKEDAERADRPEVTLPPRKRLSIVHRLGYEAGESSAAVAARPIEGRRADYGLIGVNIRVTELAAVQEQDTHDIYGVMEDAQHRQTEMFQRVETLVNDSRYHYETGRLVDQEARCSREAGAHSIGFSSAGHLVTALGEIQALQAREQARVGAPEGAGSST
nr:hypothetical protein [Tanacetum cinerariifolium]